MNGLTSRGRETHESLRGFLSSGGATVLPWNNSPTRVCNLPILSRFHFSPLLHHRPAKRRFTAGKIIPPLHFTPTGGRDEGGRAAAARARKRMYAFYLYSFMDGFRTPKHEYIHSREYVFLCNAPPSLRRAASDGRCARSRAPITICGYARDIPRISVFTQELRQLARCFTLRTGMSVKA